MRMIKIFLTAKIAKQAVAKNAKSGYCINPLSVLSVNLSGLCG